MSDGSAEAPLWMPDLGDMPAGPARILIWLVVWRDGRGSCDPTNAELCKVTKLDEATVRRHTGWLEREGWAKRERRSRDDGSGLGGWRYWLNLQRLGLAPREGEREGAKYGGPSEGASENLTVVPGEGAKYGGPYFAPSVVDNCEGGRAQNIEVAKNRGSQNVEVAPGGRAQNVEVQEKRGRARARVLSNPIPPSFAFRDDEQKNFMEAVAAVCGVGLCRFHECEGLDESLAIAFDKWMVEGLDADLDIVPVLKRITAHPRAKPIYDFGVAWITDDIRKHREARLAREAKKAAKAAAGEGKPQRRGASSELDRMLARGKTEDRHRRVAQLRRDIARIARGEGQDFDLPASERSKEGTWRDDAFTAVLITLREELAGLEAVESVNGGGNG